MFYLFLLINCYLVLILYKKYFKLNIYILIGYIVLNLISLFFNHYNHIIDSIIFFYIIVLLYLSFIIDIKEMWISDLTIIGILCLMIIKIVINCYLYEHKVVFEGLILILCITVIIILVQIILKKELMGFGDLKLFFVLSINYSLIKVIYLLTISSLIGIIYYYLFKKKNEFPFGPAIIIAYVILELI